ncbi:MAG TPA: UdgX family uracil-DNA binding protein [Luteitalea sp.]|nr:UdgX family uracil-DNA binding protein [Luteitalea sp.]
MSGQSRRAAPSMAASASQVVAVPPPATFSAWLAIVDELLARRLPPQSVSWTDGAAPTDLFAADARSYASLPPLETDTAAAARTWAPAFTSEVRAVMRHRDPRRWDLLYRMAWRIAGSEPRLLGNPVDADVRRLREWSQQVRRDVHKMHAFVRFRKVSLPDGEAYIAWFRPDHLILPAVKRFFVERFNGMHWSILTPDGSLHWDGTTCHDGPPAPRDAAPSEDALEELWRTYYGAIFNPARTNLTAMRREMPRRYWDLLPETRDMAALVAAAPERTSAMVQSQSDAGSARPFVPETTSLATLREASRACRGCDLYRHATQTVFGEGVRKARIVLVGEQPGDEEDTRGQPFVGPAGRVLDAALEEAGVDRADVYVTNAVKHFKFEPRGKWRIHKKPEMAEVRACRPWLEAELRSVAPTVVVCLGATAAQSLLGPQARVGTAAAPAPSPWAPSTLITYHPSAVLRARDEASRADMRARLVHDLRLAGQLAAAASA